VLPTMMASGHLVDHDTWVRTILMHDDFSNHVMIQLLILPRHFQSLHFGQEARHLQVAPACGTYHVTFDPASSNLPYRVSARDCEALDPRTAYFLNLSSYLNDPRPLQITQASNFFAQGSQRIWWAQIPQTSHLARPVTWSANLEAGMNHIQAETQSACQ
jgi:hypothetical protein